MVVGGLTKDVSAVVVVAGPNDRGVGHRGGPWFAICKLVGYPGPANGAPQFCHESILGGLTKDVSAVVGVAGPNDWGVGRGGGPWCEIFPKLIGFP